MTTLIALILAVHPPNVELAPKPFARFHRSVEAHLKTSTRHQELLGRMRKASGPLAQIGYKDVRPDEYKGMDDHPFSSVWGHQEGVLLYFASGGPNRLLPSSLPFIGAQGFHVSLPHRAVWYRVLSDGESLESWVKSYVDLYSKWNVGGRGVQCDVQFGTDPGKVSLKVTSPPAPAWPAGADRVLNLLPDPPNNYFISRTNRDETVTRGYVRQVGQIVFWSTSSELFRLDLEALAREIRGAGSDYIVDFYADGIPERERSNFSQAVRKVAAPNLQQRDDESTADYRERTVLAAWQLELLTLGLEEMRSASLHLDGLQGGDGPLTFELRLRTVDGAAAKLLGQPVRSASRLGTFYGQRSWATAAFNGRLPESLVSGLSKVAGSASERTLADAIWRILANPDQEGVFKLGPISDTKPDEFGIFGAVLTDAVVLKKLDGEQIGKTVQFRTAEPEGNRPKNIGFAEKNGILYFAMSDHDVGPWLEAELERLDSSARSGVPLLAVDVDFAKLAFAPDGVGFEGAPKRFLNAIEGLVLRTGFALTSESLNDQNRFLERFESSEELVSHPLYMKLVSRYLDQKMPDLDQVSLQHWLEPNASRLNLDVRVRHNELKISGSVGRCLYRLVVGQLNNSRLRSTMSLKDARSLLEK
jgi:hypothetical protein